MWHGNQYVCIDDMGLEVAVGSLRKTQDQQWQAQYTDTKGGTLTRVFAAVAEARTFVERYAREVLGL